MKNPNTLDHSLGQPHFPLNQWHALTNPSKSFHLALLPVAATDLLAVAVTCCRVRAMER